jgi:hypothetical protein
MISVDRTREYPYAGRISPVPLSPALVAGSASPRDVSLQVYTRTSQDHHRRNQLTGQDAEVPSLDVVRSDELIAP